MVLAGSFVLSLWSLIGPESVAGITISRNHEYSDANNHIAVHHQLTNHNIDWDSAQGLTYSAN